MGTLNEDLSAIKAVEDTIIANKVAKFAYTDEAYNQNDADGVTEYNVNNAQNIPTADPSVLKVNNTVLSKGYRAQASSITRMLMNHFLGRLSYNVNKVNDGFSNLVATLIKHRGTANGFATLDENGRIPYSQLPESAMEYKGQWNAETNTPTLVNGTGTKGDFYVVSVAGTHNFGSGDIQFFVNDRVIYDGSVWARLSAGDVKTVNNISPENGNIPLTGKNIPVSSTDPTLLSDPLTTNRYANNSVTTEKIADNAVTNAKIKDPISVAKGGTGQSTAKGAQYQLLNDVNEVTSAIADDSTFIGVYQSPSVSTGAVYKRRASTVWNYIQSKISSVLGLTATQYNGNAKTATNAVSANTANTAKTATQATGTTPFDASIKEVTAGTVTRAVAQKVMKSGNGYISRIALGLTNEKSQFSDGIISLGNNDEGTSWEDFTFKKGTGGEVITSTTINNQTVNIASFAYRTGANTVYTCPSSASVVAKKVSVKGFTLTTGACIRVVFENGNRAASPTLNVNSTGAKEIRVKQGSEYVPLSAENGALGQGAYGWQSNTILELFYTGTYWIVNENAIVHEKLNSELGYLSSRVFINGRKEIWGGTSPYDITANESKIITISSDLPINDDISNHSLSVITEIESTYVKAYGTIKLIDDLIDNPLKFSIYSRNLTNNSYRVKTVHIFVTGY